MTKEQENALLALFGEEVEQTPEVTEEATPKQTEAEQTIVDTDVHLFTTNNVLSTKETPTEQTEESADTTDSDEDESEKSADSETKKQKLSQFEEKILAEMNKRASDGDTQLASGLQNKDKSIKECATYLNEKAKALIVEKARTGAVCVQVDDPVVYGWAVHYYTESKETLEAECPALKQAEERAKATKAQKQAEQTTKKVFANPLLKSLVEKGAKVATDGEVAVTKTTQRKDKDGNLLFSKNVRTDASGTKTTTIEKDGRKFTMTEFSLF